MVSYICSRCLVSEPFLSPQKEILYLVNRPSLVPSIPFSSLSGRHPHICFLWDSCATEASCEFLCHGWSFASGSAQNHIFHASFLFMTE